MRKAAVTQIIKDLRSLGFRITRQRRAILEYLAATDSHPSAKEVYKHVKQSHPGLTLATVYNTLGMLVRTGHLKLLDLEPANRYDTNLECHINLICVVCGKIADFGEGLSLFPEKFREQAGFQVMDYRMEYYGICSECRKQGAGHPE
jgi:Fur family transcriptional regulator, peroxide stress response regulator